MGLGTLARCLDFIDLNKHEQSFELPYTKQIKQADDALVRLALLKEQCARCLIELRSPTSVDQFQSSVEGLCKGLGKSEAVLFE